MVHWNVDVFMLKFFFGAGCTWSCRLTVPSLTTISSHYNDVIISAMASQITGITIVCPTVCSGADQREYQRSALLAFVRGIHRWPVNSMHRASNAENVSIGWRHHENNHSVSVLLSTFRRRWQDFHVLEIHPLLTWFNFNPSMDN